MKSKELPFVREMFDRIAPHYDFLNRLLSLRRDVGWRRVLAEALALPPPAKLLDVACGTADVALEIDRRLGPEAVVVGADFSLQMLRSARPKVLDAKGRPRVHLAAADAFAPPFRDDSFDAVTIAFGIRNIQDKATVLARFLDLLKPGGQAAVLELATPEAGMLRGRVSLLLQPPAAPAGTHFLQAQLCLQLSARIGGPIPPGRHLRPTDARRGVRSRCATAN